MLNFLPVMCRVFILKFLHSKSSHSDLSWEKNLGKPRGTLTSWIGDSTIECWKVDKIILQVYANPRFPIGGGELFFHLNLLLYFSRQGYLITAWLFNVFTDKGMFVQKLEECWLERYAWVPFDGDDAMLLAENLKDLQQMLDILHDARVCIEKLMYQRPRKLCLVWKMEWITVNYI